MTINLPPSQERPSLRWLIGCAVGFAVSMLFVLTSAKTTSLLWSSIVMGGFGLMISLLLTAGVLSPRYRLLQTLAGALFALGTIGGGLLIFWASLMGGLSAGK